VSNININNLTTTETKLDLLTDSEDYLQDLSEQRKVNIYGGATATATAVSTNGSMTCQATATASCNSNTCQIDALTVTCQNTSL
jgi:hypothetical protein